MSKGFAASSVSPPSPTAQKFKQTLQQQHKALEDQRVKRQPKHLLIDIVVITILAVLCGANDMVA